MQLYTRRSTNGSLRRVSEVETLPESWRRYFQHRLEKLTVPSRIDDNERNHGSKERPCERPDDRFENRKRRRTEVALPFRRPRPRGNPSARVHPDITHVETGHSTS